MGNKEVTQSAGLTGRTGIMSQDALCRIGLLKLSSDEPSIVEVVEDNEGQWLKVKLLQPTTFLNGQQLAAGTVIEVESVAFRIESF